MVAFMALTLPSPLYGESDRKTRESRKENAAGRQLPGGCRVTILRPFTVKKFAFIRVHSRFKGFRPFAVKKSQDRYRQRERLFSTRIARVQSISPTLMYSVYFAGELFSAKHLIGNSALAAAIEHLSNGEFSCRLPQTFEQRSNSARQIRDQDLEALIQSDLAIFNFDGAEIDSGTTAEFMVAKFADIPSLLLRTDFRKGGDQADEPWNLMLSFYPRTRTCLLDCLSLYKEALAGSRHYHDASLSMIERIAQSAIKELRLLLEIPPCLPAHLAEAVYQWLGRFAHFEPSESAQKIQLALKDKQFRKLVK
jgi:nucleoside 2-deoxyribosyltransferase